MAATIKTPTVLTRTGYDTATSGFTPTVTEGDKWINTGNEFLVVENGSIAEITVTLNYGTGGTVDGTALANKTVAVGAGVTKLIGPFPTALYNDASGYCTVICSAVTTVKVAILKLS